MRKTTDLDKVKKMAIAFLNMEVEETEFSPLVVIHPILENGVVNIKRNGKNDMANVLEDKEALQLFIKQCSKRIMNCSTAYNVYSIIRKSYKLTFFKYIHNFLSEEDFGMLFADAWVISENPNQDVNVSLKECVKYFKTTDKKFLMDEKELSIFDSLPEELTVYRGVAIGRNPKGLSYTLSKDKAEWFANRFSEVKGSGTVIEKHIKKEHVLAYFNSRDEDEIVVDVFAVK